MPKAIDFEQNPFLTAQQEGVLASLEPFAPQDPNDLDVVSLRQTLTTFGSVTASLFRARRRVMKADTDDMTMEDLESHLQDSALGSIASDLSAQITYKHIAMLTGISESEGQDMETVYGHNLGDTLVRRRSQHAAAVWIHATSLVTTRLPEEDRGLWIRADDANRSNGHGPTVLMNQEEADQLSGMKRRIRDSQPTRLQMAAKIGSSSLGNAFRIGKAGARIAVDERRGRTTAMTRFSEMAEVHLTSIPEFTDDEVAFSLQVANRYRRHLIRASERDRSIAEDPRARLLAFLGARLAVTRSTRNEDTADFKRIAKFYSKHKPSELELQLDPEIVEDEPAASSNQRHSRRQRRRP